MKRSVYVMTVLALTLAIPAGAQILGRDRPERPNRAVFGSTKGLTGQLLTAEGTLGGGALDLGEDNAGDSSLSPTHWNTFTSASAGASYTLDHAWIGLDSSLQTSWRRFPSEDETSLTTYGDATLVWRAPLGRRTDLDGRLTGSYQPIAVTTLFPSLFGDHGGPASPVDFNLTTKTEQYVAGSTGISLTHSFSVRSTFSAGYDYARAGASAVLLSRDDSSAFVRYNHEIVRGLTVQAGYTSRRGTYSGDEEGAPVIRDIRTDSIDAGITYSRALSLSRRTHLEFSSGSTAVSDGGARRYDVVGNATLTRELGRTWEAALVYDRQAGFVDTLAAPVFSNTVAASVGGLLTRAISIDVGGGAAQGQIGVVNTNGYWSYQGNIQVGIALSRILECAFDYSAYSYRFDGTDFLPVGTSTRATQQVVQVSFNVWVPLFQRVRKPHVAR